MKVFLWLLPILGAYICANGQIPIKLTEYSPSNKTIVAGDGGIYNWLEINNTAYEPLELSQFELVVTPENGSPVTIALPAGRISTGEFKMIWFGAPASKITGRDIYVTATVPNVKSEIVLRHKSSGSPLDNMAMPSLLKDDETLNEQRLLNLPPVILPKSQSTPYSKNFLAPSWSKLTNHTAFQGRDSSPNALLLFKNKLWVMAGWRFEPENPENDGYHSRSDIYNSDDGINWKLVNPSPPYQAYSGYLVYKNKMWAYDDYGIWTSEDGVTWDNLGTSPVRASSRVLIVNDTIWFVDTYGNVGYSPDGLNFTITRNGDAPWGVRDWPGFVYHNNKFWVYIGRSYVNGLPHANNDVWSSSDGINWTLETNDAVSPSRFWHMYGTFEDKMWIIGGASYDSIPNENNGNFNDAWYSQNGKDWKLLSENNYPNRHAAMTKNFNDRLYFMCGYGGLSLDRLYNDVWVFNYRIYYSRKGTDLSQLSSWGTLPDGSGIQPLSFDQSSGIYVITNDSAYTVSSSWWVSGTNSKIILGNGRDTVTLKVKPGADIQGGIHLTERSRLEWSSTSVANIAETAPSSTVAFVNTASTLPSVLNGYYNLEIANSQLKTALGNIKVGHDLRLTGSTLADDESDGEIWIYGDLYADNNNNSRGINVEIRGGENTNVLPLNGEPKISDLIIRKDSGSVKLGANLHVSNMLTYVSGDLQKDSYQLMFDQKGSMQLAGTMQNLKVSDFITPASEAYDLVINNPNDVTLGQSIQINGILRMTSGKLALNEYNLGVAYALGGSELSYVKTDSTGMLQFKANQTRVTLPIGNNTGFIPVTVTNNKAEGVIGINLSSIQRLDTLEPDRFVNTTWKLDAGTMSDIDVDLQLSWKELDEGGLFDRNECGAAVVAPEGFINKQIPSAANTDMNNSFSVKAKMKFAGTIVVGDYASTVTKQYQTVSVVPSGTIRKTYGDPGFELEAGSSSHLPVTLLLDNIDVLKQNVNFFDILKAGTTEISVFSAETDDYAPSDTVKVTVIVAQAPQPPLDIDTTTIVKRYNDEPFTILEETTSVYGPIVIESERPAVVQATNDGVVEINDVGRTQLDIYSPGNENYLPSDTVNVTVVVRRALQNIVTNNMLDRKVLYIDTPFAPVIFDSDLPPAVDISNKTVAAYENGKIVLKSSGETTVTIEQPGNKYYVPFPRQTFLLRVVEWHNLRVYPNLTNGWVNIIMGDAAGSEYRYELYDIQGRRMQNGIISPNDNYRRIDLSAYPSNIYILKVMGPNYNKSVKILKQ